MLMYTGKGAVAGDVEVAVGARVVLSLMGPILDLGCCVAVDIYYNSPGLVKALIERSSDAYGTAQHAKLLYKTASEGSDGYLSGRQMSITSMEENGRNLPQHGALFWNG